MNREIESAALRPLARGLTRSLDVLRSILRDQCYKDLNHYSDKVCINKKMLKVNAISFVIIVDLNYTSQKKKRNTWCRLTHCDLHCRLSFVSIGLLYGRRHLKFAARRRF